MKKCWICGRENDRNVCVDCQAKMNARPKPVCRKCGKQLTEAEEYNHGDSGLCNVCFEEHRLAGMAALEVSTRKEALRVQEDEWEAQER